MPQSKLWLGAAGLLTSSCRWVHVLPGVISEVTIFQTWTTIKRHAGSRNTSLSSVMALSDRWATADLQCAVCSLCCRVLRA